jgi:signal transduction histidine kinase
MTTILHGSGDQPDLSALAGIRSGEPSYYRALQRSDERMQQTVRTLDAISRALLRTAEGPRTVVEEAVRAAAAHLRADWMVLALADGALSDSNPRFLVLAPDGGVHDRMSSLPPSLRRLVRQVREGVDDGSFAEDEGWVRVPMTLDGAPVGALAGRHGLPDGLELADVSVLRILASQAATATHTARLYQSGLALRRRAQILYDEVAEQARDLTVRTDELRSAERRLHAAEQRELLDAERHRIALELHDSVAQTVLSAGLAVDLSRSDVAALPGGEKAAARLGEAKDVIRRASEQLRSVIYALHHSRTPDDLASLPELLHEMAAQHQAQLAVTVRIEGRPVPLGTEVEHSLARTAGEALFNAALHADATKAHVRLRYATQDVTLSVSDDGTGDPATMRRTLRLAQTNAADGRHRGLVGMASRAAQHAGTFAIRRARLGGVTIEVRIPLAQPTPAPDRIPAQPAAEPRSETA